ncbi:major allergen Pru av 1 [Cannabis sativa]|uniref:Bet v I/Major latex protein domain-containing protein n=1 Tax=Cannabis sativa TaxID=3483 RepID=A0A803Q4X8_CANSA|nr:major allergen Pru av 1 [Cannabis sativa]
MGVFVYETEFSSNISPTRLFKALILDGDNLIPKIAPQAIKQVETLEGDGGAGTIKKITFGEGSSFKYVKHRVDSIDQDNLCHSYTLIEGDALTDKLEKICYETKLVASPDGVGSVINTVSKYYTINDAEIKEEDVKQGKEKASQLFKLFEKYLNDHPDAYNN